MVQETLGKERFEKMQKYWNFSGIHLRLTWEDLDKIPVEIKTICKDYVTNFSLNQDLIFERMRKDLKPGLFIYSTMTGTGKTSIIHQIAKDLMMADKTIRKMKYLTGVEMFFELKKTFNPQGGLHESDILDDILECDIFFLDDFDKLIRWSAYERERATLIIDKRYTSLRPMVFTSNKSLQTLKSENLIEQHIFSRLVEMCQEVEIKSYDDFRLKTAISLKPKERKFL
jgi:hypothetical protein